MQFIGQPKLKNFIENATLETCPHFIIFQGSKQCGKTLITQALADKLGALKVEFQSSAQEVRNIIDTVYQIKSPCVYWCETLDKMRPEASNALLKVTEETPKNAYIVLHTVGTPLATLKSRSQYFAFEPYSMQDYEDYSKQNGIDLPEHAEILMKSCNSLAEFKYYTVTEKFKTAYELADMILKYMGEVTTVNAFKILNRLALKKDAEGLDPIFFLTVLVTLYISLEGAVPYGDIIMEKSLEALQYLRNDIFSKQAIMDKWVLTIMKGIDARCL